MLKLNVNGVNTFQKLSEDTKIINNIDRKASFDHYYFGWGALNIISNLSSNLYHPFVKASLCAI